MTTTKYLVVKVNIEHDASKSIDEVMDQVASNLDYSVEFNEIITLEDGTEVSAKITNTEICGLLDSDPT
jgi:hypothetical protein